MSAFTMRAFGDRLRYLRIKKQFTWDDIAAQTGVHPLLIRIYEMGLQLPPLEIILKFIQLFGVSPKYLLCVAPLPCKDDSDGMEEAVDEKFSALVLQQFCDRFSDRSLELIMRRELNHQHLNTIAVALDMPKERVRQKYLEAKRQKKECYTSYIVNVTGYTIPMQKNYMSTSAKYISNQIKELERQYGWLLLPVEARKDWDECRVGKHSFITLTNGLISLRSRLNAAIHSAYKEGHAWPLELVCLSRELARLQSQYSGCGNRAVPKGENG